MEQLNTSQDEEEVRNEDIISQSKISLMTGVKLPDFFPFSFRFIRLNELKLLPYRIVVKVVQSVASDLQLLTSLVLEINLDLTPSPSSLFFLQTHSSHLCNDWQTSLTVGLQEGIDEISELLSV